MKLTVLGSGTSAGVPLIGCTCPVCTSSNPKNKRWRSSCLFEVAGKFILVDMGPDLRNQALAFGINRVDAVLLTHTHADHLHGIDEMRIYNIYQKEVIPVFGNQKHLKHIENMFPYIFNPPTNYPSLVPKLQTRAVEGRFEFKDVPIQMIPCDHGPAGTTYNYRIGNMAWLTDTNGIPPQSLLLLKDLDVLFLDGLRTKPHPTHFNLKEAVAMAQKIGAKQTYFIHLTHEYDHEETNKTLPEGIELAYDGLVVESKKPLA